jgi:hypothetical protein
MASEIAAGVAIINPAALASKLGVAMPVDETVTTVSTSVARGIDSLGQRIDKQLTGVVEIGLARLRPTQRLQIPFERPHRVASPHARTFEYSGQPPEFAMARGKSPMRREGDLAFGRTLWVVRIGPHAFTDEGSSPRRGALGASRFWSTHAVPSSSTGLLAGLQNRS